MSNIAVIVESSNVSLYLSTSNFSFCWKFAFIQFRPKKGDHSNLSDYWPISLTSCLSESFESILNRKVLKLLYAHNLYDCYYGFHKGQSTDDDLVFQANSWSSSLRNFSEIFAVAFVIKSHWQSLEFDLISILSLTVSILFSVPLSQITFQIGLLLLLRIVSVLILSILTVVPQGSVLLLSFINNFFSLTQYLFHFFADDSTLHFSPSFTRQPT